MNFLEKRTLGRTNLKVCPIGISSSFGATASTYEEAFEMGCNYFTLGTFIRGKSKELIIALKNIIAKGKREELVIAYLNYSHITPLMKRSVNKVLKLLGTDYIDTLLLGYYSSKPNKRIIDASIFLKEKGLIKSNGITSHNRKMIPELDKEKLLDVFHIRYNAINSGAEQDIFPFLDPNDKPGIVSFTATGWQKLLDQKKYPKGVDPIKAGDCYRFVLSNPNVNICMMGVKNSDQLHANFNDLKKGPLTESEMKNIRKIGDYLYGKPRK